MVRTRLLVQLGQRLGLLLRLGCALAGSCTPAGASSPAGADASRWFDVSLPDVLPPDGFILTQVATEGGTTEVDPAAPCLPDAGTDVGAPLDAGTARPDASDGSRSGSAPADARPDGPVCAPPLSPGDLVFNEAMIASAPGSSDRGQWLEVVSTLPCAVDLLGLHASAPHGATTRSMDVTEDVWLPAGGFFLIADTLDPTENGDLPGLVLAWTGSPSDAIHKTSDTITLSLGAVVLDTLAYPDKKRADGTSLAFPEGCPPGLRADFTSWQPSTSSWTPGLFGTPNAPNRDVMCTVPTIPRCVRAMAARRPPWR